MKKVLFVIYITLLSTFTFAQTTYYEVTSVYNKGAGKMYPKKSSFIVGNGLVVIMLDDANASYLITDYGVPTGTTIEGVYFIKTTYTATTGGVKYTISIYKSSKRIYAVSTNLSNGVRLIYDLK